MTMDLEPNISYEEAEYRWEYAKLEERDHLLMVLAKVLVKKEIEYQEDADDWNYGL
jgi:hypothetical protein